MLTFVVDLKWFPLGISHMRESPAWIQMTFNHLWLYQIIVLCTLWLNTVSVFSAITFFINVTIVSLTITKQLFDSLTFPFSTIIRVDIEAFSFNLSFSSIFWKYISSFVREKFFEKLPILLKKQPFTRSGQGWETSESSSQYLSGSSQTWQLIVACPIKSQSFVKN